MRSRSLLIVTLAVTSMLFACQQDPSTKASAQDFSFKTLKGETQSLSSLRGKPLIVNFFGLH
jgi:hypothetical protein